MDLFIPNFSEIFLKNQGILAKMISNGGILKVCFPNFSGIFLKNQGFLAKITSNGGMLKVNFHEKSYVLRLKS